MAANPNTVQISVEFTECFAHLFKVTMTLDGASRNQCLSLPIWTPGSYMVREFAQHIVSIKAYEHDLPVAVEKINKNTFKVKNQSSSLSVVYQVYGFDSSIRAAFIDDNQAFFNGTALFLRPHHMEDATYLMNLLRPTADDSRRHWQVATGMPAVNVDNRGFGTYKAESYQELVDYPCQISEMKRLKFQAGDLPHEMVLVSDVRPCDEERLIKDLSKLCEQQIAMFGNSAPFSSYLFIARFEEVGHGGLEHRNSSMLLASPYSLPKKGMVEPDSHYRSFLSLCSHEYFHAWNVKRLKPHNFVKYDFDNECYTTMLWMFEGITAYYDDLLVKRSRLISLSSYLDLMSKNYSKLLRNRGRQRQSLAEASFDAWIKFYRPNENSQNSTVSYYLKGSFIALYLDLLIRSKSNHQISLDNVMTEAFKKFSDRVGIKETEFFDLLCEVGKIDAMSVKQKYIYGKDELPFSELLSEFGIDLVITPDELSLDDKTKMQAFLGIKLRFDENDRAMISFVECGAPGMQAGISPGDELVAINNIRLDHANAADLLASLRVGEGVSILCARKKVMRLCHLMPSALPAQHSKLSLKAKLEPDQQSRLEKWLG